MKQLLKEIAMLFLIVPISVAILFFAMQKAEQTREVDSLSATVEKKDLTISSPVFGSIDKYNVEEGDFVKKGQTIATISIIDKKESSQFASETFSYEESSKSGKILVKSPADAVVSKKELAEKSTIKPEANLVTLYPLEDTQIKIQVDQNTNIKSYQDIYLTDNNNNGKYNIKLTSKLPVSDDKSREISYFAAFTDQNQAKDFYNNQPVKVRAQKQSKALTGKIESLLIQITKNLPFKV